MHSFQFLVHLCQKLVKYSRKCKSVWEIGTFCATVFTMSFTFARCLDGNCRRLNKYQIRDIKETWSAAGNVNIS